MMRMKEVFWIRFVQTNRNLSDILTKWKAFSQEFSDVFRRGLLDRESSRVEIRLIPIMTGDELRIFKHGVEEKADVYVDPFSIG